MALAGNEWFLVKFDHTPYQNVTKRHRRTGICSIFYLTDSNDYEDAVKFASKICGEKNKIYVTESKLICSEHDNYVKAYARNVTLKKALQNIMQLQSHNCLDWNFEFDNDTFKSFMTALAIQHPHGTDAAMKLLKDSDYRKAK
jgi:hypothetical protein